MKFKWMQFSHLTLRNVLVWWLRQISFSGGAGTQGWSPDHPTVEFFMFFLLKKKKKLELVYQLPPLRLTTSGTVASGCSRMLVMPSCAFESLDVHHVRYNSLWNNRDNFSSFFSKFVFFLCLLFIYFSDLIFFEKEKSWWKE